MNKEEFSQKTLRELEALTGTSYQRWSEYFNSKTDMTLGKARGIAEKLGMTLIDFVDAFETRRTRK